MDIKLSLALSRPVPSVRRHYTPLYTVMCMLYCRPSRLPSSTITTGDAGDQHVAQRHHAVDNSHDNGSDDADDAFQARSDGVEYSCDLVLLAAFHEYYAGRGHTQDTTAPILSGDQVIQRFRFQMFKWFNRGISQAGFRYIVVGMDSGQGMFTPAYATYIYTLYSVQSTPYCTTAS